MHACSNFGMIASARLDVSREPKNGHTGDGVMTGESFSFSELADSFSYTSANTSGIKQASFHATIRCASCHSGPPFASCDPGKQFPSFISPSSASRA